MRYHDNLLTSKIFHLYGDTSGYKTGQTPGPASVTAFASASRNMSDPLAPYSGMGI